MYYLGIKRDVGSSWYDGVQVLPGTYPVYHLRDLVTEISKEIPAAEDGRN